jgi:CxxH/CxxC protein (TIGR04129 family)
MLIWFACEEHIEIVIEEMVDRYALAPVVSLVSQKNISQLNNCYWCECPPQYRLEMALKEK